MKRRPDWLDPRVHRPGGGRRALLAAIGIAAALLHSGMGHAEETAAARIEHAIERYAQAMASEARDERIALFAESERLFAAAAEAGTRSADLEANLGNAALQAEHLGSAILAYRRALRIDPGHARARRNLAHAREQLPEAIPRPGEGGLTDTFFFWHDRLSGEDVQLVAAACFALAAGLLALTLLRRVPGLRVAAGGLFAVWAVLIVSIALDPDRDGSDAGVVTVPDAIARAADSINAPQRFSEPLPAGTELRILEDRGDWIQIELWNGRSAWLAASAVTRVVETPGPGGDS